MKTLWEHRSEAEPRAIAQINLASVEKFLAELRQNRNVSLSTCNHYIRAIKSFRHWLVKNDRLVRGSFYCSAFSDKIKITVHGGSLAKIDNLLIFKGIDGE